MVQEYRRIEPWKTDDTDMKAGLEMRDKRRDAGLTEGQLAYLLGMERHQYLSYERGEERCPATRRAQIDAILAQVKSGEVEIPNLNKEE